mgnify:CR=1 FL=1
MTADAASPVVLFDLDDTLMAHREAVVAGIHPETGRPYAWPADGLEQTEPAKLPRVTSADLAEILAACSQVLLR